MPSPHHFQYPKVTPVTQGAPKPPAPVSTAPKQR
jgi:hypothetical protein